MIVRVGAGGILPQNFTLRHLADEHHVTAEVKFFGDFAGKHGIRVVSEVDKTVFASLKSHEICKLIGISSGLHPEVTNRFKRNIFRQHADIKLPALFHHFPGEIALLNGHHELCRHTRHLHGGVDDAPVVPPVLTGQHEQTVGEVKERGGVLFGFSLSESNDPADPSEPCRDGPRRGPFRGRCHGWHPDRAS